MDLAKTLLYIYPDLDLLNTVRLQDDGEGAYIAHWGDARPMPTQEQLNAAVLPSIMRDKINQLKQHCTQAIQSGFVSDALGATHIYDSALPQDQINLLGAVLAGEPIAFSCTDANGVKAQRLHSLAQIQTVYLHGMQHIQANRKRFYELKAAVEQGMSEAEVNAISWFFD